MILALFISACVHNADSPATPDTDATASSGSSGSSGDTGGAYIYADGILTITHTFNPFPGELIGLFGEGTGTDDGLERAAATLNPTPEGDLPVNVGAYGNTSVLWTLGTLEGDSTSLDHRLWESMVIADTLADGDSLGLTVRANLYGVADEIFFCTRVTSKGIMPGDCSMFVQDDNTDTDSGFDTGTGTDTDSGTLDTVDSGTDSGSSDTAGGDTSGDTDSGGSDTSTIDTGTDSDADTDSGFDTGTGTDTDSGSDTDSGFDTDTNSGTPDTGDSAGTDTGTSETGSSDTDSGDTDSDESVFDQGDFGTIEVTCDTSPFVRSDGWPLFSYEEDGVCGIYLPGYGLETEPGASADLTLTGYEVGRTYTTTLEVLNISTSDVVTFVADFGGEEPEVITVSAGESGSITLTWKADDTNGTLRVWTTSTSSWEYDGVLISYLIKEGELDADTDSGFDTDTDSSSDTSSSGDDTDSSTDSGDTDTSTTDTDSGTLDTGDSGTDSGSSDTAGGDTSGDSDSGDSDSDADTDSGFDTGTDSSSDTSSSGDDTDSSTDSGDDGDTAGGGDTATDSGGDSGDDDSGIVYESVFVADDGGELSSCVTSPFNRNDAHPLFAYNEDGVCGVYLPGDGTVSVPLMDAEFSIGGYELEVVYTATIQVLNASPTDSVTFVADFGGKIPETLTLAAGEVGEMTLSWEADNTNGTLRVWTTSISRWGYDGVMTAFRITY